MTVPIRIERSVSLAWDQTAAFARLTDDPMVWWPWNPRDIRAQKVKRVGFEQRRGGVFFQEHADGHLSKLGEVRDWDPPHHISLAFHPPAAPETEERVELHLDAERTGTRLTLLASSRRHPWRERRAPDAPPPPSQMPDPVTDPHQWRRALIHIVRAIILMRIAQ